MKKIYVSPYLFFFFENGKICLWEYLTNQNWELEKEYLERLSLLATCEEPALVESEIDKALLSAGVISHAPFECVDWGWGKIAQIYHYGTKNFAQSLPLDDESTYVRKYIDFCTDAYSNVTADDLRIRRDGARFPLAKPDLSDLDGVSLKQALYGRKTTRTFYGTPISLSSLSSTLYLAFGEIHGEWSDLENRGLELIAIRKSAPSGGGIHPTNAYVVAFKVDGLDPGVYHYESDTHTLVQIAEGNYESSIGRMLSGQGFAAQLSAGIFLTSAFDKVWLKYRHSRAYRVPFIDVGHVSQTFHMVANALGLNTWLSGVFRDDDVSDLLKLSPLSTEQPIFFVGVGNGNGDYLHPELIAAIQERENFGE